MKVRIAIFICFLYFQHNSFYVQDSASIYEYGITISNYEDNFKNLINKTQERYNFYRNYFSSDQPVGCSTKGHTPYELSTHPIHCLGTLLTFSWNRITITRL